MAKLQLAKLQLGNLRTGFLAALILGGFAGMQTPSAAARDVQCKHTLARYNATIKEFEDHATHARALAELNPVYESDAAYYAAVLADAKQCLRTMAPTMTAAR
jgi:hypothetical protein